LSRLSPCMCCIDTSFRFLLTDARESPLEGIMEDRPSGQKPRLMEILTRISLIRVAPRRFILDPTIPRREIRTETFRIPQRGSYWARGVPRVCACLRAWASCSS